MGDADWMELGHRIAPLVRTLVEQATHFLVLSTTGGGYVQMLGYTPGQCLAEADSGEWTDIEFTVEQHSQLRELGWRRPDERTPRQEYGNYWLECEAPVDLYGLVVLLLRTMAEVYRARACDITVDFELRADRTSAVDGHMRS